jgi:hypothetical protein
MGYGCFNEAREQFNVGAEMGVSWCTTGILVWCLALALWLLKSGDAVLKFVYSISMARQAMSTPVVS